jgi:hypothetical protein
VTGRGYLELTGYADGWGVSSAAKL